MLSVVFVLIVKFVAGDGGSKIVWTASVGEETIEALVFVLKLNTRYRYVVPKDNPVSVKVVVKLRLLTTE